MQEKEFAEIPYSEFKDRNAKAQQLMAADGLDAVFLFCRENITYYCGWRDTWDFSFMRGAILQRGADPAMVSPVILAYGLEKHTYLSDVVAYEEVHPDVDPVKVFVDKVKELGLASGKIGLEMGVGMFPTGATMGQIQAIRDGLPEAEFVDAAPMIWQQRSIKTPWEQDVMREICSIVVRGYARGAEFCRAGVSERDLQTEMWRSFIEDGVADSTIQGGVIMRSHQRGVRTPAFTGRATERIMADGDMIMLDGGPTLKGYFTDVQRQLCVGRASDMVKKLHELAMVGFEAMEAALVPGAPAKELFLAPERAMREHRPDMGFPWRFMGHAIGLQIHEFPWLLREEETLLEPGMIFCVEIPAYDIPQWREMGSFAEDMYLVTEDGFENLTAGLPRIIFECGI